MSNHSLKKDIKIILNMRSSLMVRSDRKRIEQVLMNLLSNAILSSPQGGKIKVFFAIEPLNLKQDMVSSEYESLNCENKKKLN
jgi:signal transduction histidine kinase